MLRRHPDHQLFLSFPGIADVIAATLIGEIGEDRSRYPTAGVLAAEAGLAPVTRASGRTSRARFRYAANDHLRAAYTWWAYTSIRLSPWARTNYDLARSRGQHHHRALRGLAARWNRVLWRCWQDGTTLRRHPPPRRLTSPHPHARPAVPRRQLQRARDHRELTLGVCRVHFARNLLALVPKTHQDMVAAVFRTIFAQPDPETVASTWDQVRDQLADRFPKIAVLMDDANAEVLAFAAFPRAHWAKMWSTNPLERLNKEVKRRARVVGIFPNEASVIRLVGAVLADVHDEWQAGDRRYLSEGSMAMLYPERDTDRVAELTPRRLTPRITSKPTTRWGAAKASTGGGGRDPLATDD